MVNRSLQDYFTKFNRTCSLTVPVAVQSTPAYSSLAQLYSPVQQPSLVALHTPVQLQCSPTAVPHQTTTVSDQHASAIVQNPPVKPNPDSVHPNHPTERLNLHVSSVSLLLKSYRAAFNDLNWKNAMCDEYNALIKNKTWTLVPRPPDTNIVRCMWLFRHNCLADGSLSRYEAHLVANGSTQLEGIDVDETFSSVVKPGMFLSQKKYAIEIIERAHMITCNPSQTPIDTESKLGADGDPVSDSTFYRSLAGSLQYLTLTRLNISYVGTFDYDLQLFSSSTTDLVAYSDADWAGCLTTRRSTSGYCVFLGNNLLLWSSKRQPTLSRSSAEAEYRGVVDTVAETCWLRNLLRELHTHLSPLHLFTVIILGKTINELHAMLKLHEQTLPKNNAPALHAIRAAELLKKKKNAASGAGGSGIFVIELNTILNRSWIYDTGYSTHICNTTQGLRASRKLKPGALSLAFEKCISCMSGKMARKPSTHQVKRAKDLLGLIHTDVCGQFKIMSRQGASYFVTFTYDFSRCGYVYLLKHKHEVFETFKVFQKEVENQLGKTIKSLRSDRRGEYISQEFLNHLKDHGIIAHCTPPYTPQHNGALKRRNRTLLDMVRSMMSQTTIPKSFWDYALETAARILNMVSTKKVEKTPYEVWHGQAPKLSYLKVWGYEALVKQDTLTKPDKLEPRSINLITQEASGSLEDLEIIQEEETHPSIDTSLNHEEDAIEIDEPQSDIVPIRRSTRIRNSLDSAYYDYGIWQMDVKSAFLNGYLNEDVYMEQPEGEATYILGIKVYRDRSRSIPMQEKLNLSKSQGTSTHGMQNVPYASAVGSIMYAVRCTRPDLAFAQNVTSRFQQNPGDLHWTTVKNITKTGYVFILNGGVIDWKSAKESIFATSYAEAKYIAAFDASKEAVWVRKFIYGLGVVPTIKESISMYCDNTGEIAIANESGITKELQYAQPGEDNQTLPKNNAPVLHAIRA
nr:retrotransposon protein, putative, Ty1-copia subclass [Tanacetum cinerariifolium]